MKKLIFFFLEQRTMEKNSICEWHMYFSKKLFGIVSLIVFPPFSPQSFAQNAPSVAFHESEDGEIGTNEYQVISSNGSVTRRPCPYTCENRGLSIHDCAVWQSKDKTLCYVWDKRLPQNAVPLNKESEERR